MIKPKRLEVESILAQVFKKRRNIYPSIPATLRISLSSVKNNWIALRSNNVNNESVLVRRLLEDINSVSAPISPEVSTIIAVATLVESP